MGALPSLHSHHYKKLNLRVSTASISAAGFFPMGAFIHFTAMSVERKTPVSTASLPAAGFFRGNLLTHLGFHGEHGSSSSFWMGAFTSDVMSVEWHAGVSTVGVSAAGFFHGSLRFSRVCVE